MGRPPKKKEEQPKQQPGTETPAAQAMPGAPPLTEARAAPAKPSEAERRIQVRLDSGGRILPMRDETREELRRALEASPDALGEGYKPAAGAKFITEEFAGRMLDALSAAQGFVLAKTTKVPYEKAAAAMRFDAEERKTLAPPACVLLNQYGGAWLARHGPLVEFSVKFGAIEAAKIDKAVALAREQKASQPKKEGGQQ